MFQKSKANFSRMTEKEMFVSKLLQKTLIDVDEFGVEAAASTVSTLTSKSMKPILNIRFNRPFFFVVKDNVSGIILFMGKVHRP